MGYQFIEVSADNTDFIALTNELSSKLKKLTNDSGESSFSPEVIEPYRDACLIVYDQEIPVACGVFRFHSGKACELKRMYSKRKGAGHELLSALENLAVEKGYRFAVLSTRRINTNAVDFYFKNGYKEIAPYGKYIGAAQSICMGKSLCGE